MVSADAYSAHGFSPSAIIFDELHAQPNRELYDALTTGTGARRQPLTVAISTAGYERTSLCYELYDHARKVRDGVIQRRCVPAGHPRCGPRGRLDGAGDMAQGASRYRHQRARESYIAAECEKAKAAAVLRKQLQAANAERLDRAGDALAQSVEQWDRCDLRTPDPLEGRECYGGLDLSTTTDLSALVLAFPDGKMVHLMPFFWCPQDGIRKRSLRDCRAL